MKKETPMSDTKSSADTKTTVDEVQFQRNLFYVMLLNLTWQLAIAVLVPFIGGIELDKHLHTTPLWSIIGGVVALGGFVAVLIRILAEAKRRTGPYTTPHGGKK